MPWLLAPARVEGLIKRACALPFDLWHLARDTVEEEGHPAPAGMPRACTRLALRLEEAIKERAKAKQLGGQGGVLLKQNSAEANPIETPEEIAKLGGVGKSLGTQRAVAFHSASSRNLANP